MAQVTWRAPLLSLLLLAALPALARDQISAGDRGAGSGLWRVHCHGCHGDGQGPTSVGKALGAPQLRDAARLDARTDEQLVATILKGGPGPGSPAFGGFLSLLDAADLVAFLRAPLLSMADLFPESAAYTYKRYTIGPSQLARAEALAGHLAADERELTVFSVYGGQRPAFGPRLVHPDDHVGLDDLSPKARLGYLVFGPMPAGEGAQGTVALALSPGFTVVKVVGLPGTGDLHKLAAAAVGKGSRNPGERKPFVFKPSPERAHALTRLYARAVEASALAAKEEADRHLFDPPEPTAKVRPSESGE